MDARSDIYSLGVVLFERMTGRVPFEGPTPLSLAMKHKMETPKNVREWNALVPPGLAAVIARCLEKDPAKLYQSAAELKTVFAEVERDLETAERDSPRGICVRGFRLREDPLDCGADEKEIIRPAGHP